MSYILQIFLWILLFYVRNSAAVCFSDKIKKRAQIVFLYHLSTSLAKIFEEEQKAAEFFEKFKTIWLVWLEFFKNFHKTAIRILEADGFSYCDLFLYQFIKNIPPEFLETKTDTTYFGCDYYILLWFKQYFWLWRFLYVQLWCPQPRKQSKTELWAKRTTKWW